LPDTLAAQQSHLTGEVELLDQGRHFGLLIEGREPHAGRQQAESQLGEPGAQGISLDPLPFRMLKVTTSQLPSQANRPLSARW